MGDSKRNTLEGRREKKLNRLDEKKTEARRTRLPPRGGECDKRRAQPLCIRDNFEPESERNVQQINGKFQKVEKLAFVLTLGGSCARLNSEQRRLRT